MFCLSIQISRLGYETESSRARASSFQHGRPAVSSSPMTSASYLSLEVGGLQHVLVGHVGAHHALAQHVARDLLHPLGPRHVEPQVVVLAEQLGALLPGRLQIEDGRVVLAPGVGRHPVGARPARVDHLHGGGGGAGVELQDLVHGRQKLLGGRGLGQGPARAERSEDDESQPSHVHYLRARMARTGWMDEARSAGSKAPSTEATMPSATAVATVERLRSA